MAEFVALKVDSRARLLASVRRVKGQFASMAPELRSANERSVQWLQSRATEILEAKVEENDRSPSTARDAGRLRNAIAHDRISSVDEKGFRFGLARALNATSAGIYWRSIESGTTKFVGRPYPVKVFPFGGARSVVQFRMIDPGRVTQVRDARGRLTSNFVAETGGPRVRRPIPAYHYLQEAVNDFLSANVYEFELARASEQWRKVLATAKRKGISPRAVRGG